MRRRVLRLLRKFARLLFFCYILAICWLFFTENIEDLQILKTTTKDTKSFGKESQDKKIVANVSKKQLGNFEMKSKKTRIGPGENGKPHYVKQNPEIIFYGINVECSDHISIERSIPDTRLEECKYWDYPENLPRTSVIVVIQNVGWSILLRTIHSVINRTPVQFLEEVLLINYYSDTFDIEHDLTKYIKRFNGIVHLLKSKKGDRIIQARTMGAKLAKGEVIVIMDAYCEVNVNWLPPLLTPIYRNKTTMTVPIIDSIDQKTFEYRAMRPANQHYKGIFEWGLIYEELRLSEEEAAKRKYESDPYSSPTHAGGLFAINRDYFLSLGVYDPGLLESGGENFDLSFKIWQCGGSIKFVPCSRVGHIYDGFTPVSNRVVKNNGPVLFINYKRIVETWLDPEYKENFYVRMPSVRLVNEGNLSQQLSLKKKLKCKSFNWYIKNVAYDAFKEHSKLPLNLFWGQLLNIATETCMSASKLKPFVFLEMSICNSGYLFQFLRLNVKGYLGIHEKCVDSIEHGLQIVNCPEKWLDGPWQYNKSTQLLFHDVKKTCVCVDLKENHLSLKPCGRTNNFMWIFKPTDF